MNKNEYLIMSLTSRRIKEIISENNIVITSDYCSDRFINKGNWQN